jgi:uroporphyrinogen decarboxylase
VTPLFVRALLGQPVERFPVWLMRQAGRYLPGYRAVRSQHSFLAMCRSAELAAQVSLEPVERFDVDAAIVFADILLTADACGVEVEFPDGGPQIVRPIRSPADVDRLGSPDLERVRAVPEALRLLRRALPPTKAVIGFSAAPLTLCAYLIEGSGGGAREFARARAFAAEHPAAFRRLLDRAADALAVYLRAQADAGADVLQVFDTWGAILPAHVYRETVLPSIQRLVQGLGARRPPLLLFAGIGAEARLEDALSTGVEGLSLDWRTDLARAYARVGDRVRLQGNLDPAVLLAPRERIVAETGRMLACVPPGRSHLVNLGHGILKETPPEHVGHFVEAVKAFAAPALPTGAGA